MEGEGEAAAAKPPRSQHSFGKNLRMMAAREPATSQVHRPCVHSPTGHPTWICVLGQWIITSPVYLNTPPNYKNTLRRTLPKSSLPFKTYSEFGGEQEQEQKREHQQEQRQEQSKSKIGSKSKSRSKGGSNSKSRSEQEQAQETQQKQEQQPAPEQEPEHEQERRPSKVAVEIKTPPNNKATFRVSIGGGTPPRLKLGGKD